MIIRNRYKKYYAQFDEPSNIIRDIENYNNRIHGSGLISDSKQLTTLLIRSYDLFKNDQLFRGEKHMPLYVNGELTLANYAGPGTNLIERIQQGYEPKSYTDMVSKLHDINYSIASMSNDKTTQKRMVREADELMINQLRNGSELELDNRFNIGVAQLSITSKNIIEDLNIPIISNKVSNFAGELETYEPQDIQLLRDEQEITLNQINELLEK